MKTKKGRMAGMEKRGRQGRTEADYIYLEEEYIHADDHQLHLGTNNHAAEERNGIKALFTCEALISSMGHADI
jgi:hypothetical protein